MDNNFVKVGKWGECLWGINENGGLYIIEGLAGSVDEGISPWADSMAAITSANTVGTVTFPDGASLAGLFKGCKNMVTADLSGFVTDNVSNMSSMFEGCANLRELDISSFDTRRCSNMHAMFSKCANLEEILLAQDFSTEGDGSTRCDRLAVKEYGKYKKAKPIYVEGFRVIYHDNLDEDRTEETRTTPGVRYIIEEPMFSSPSDRAVFVSWNTDPDAKGAYYRPGKAVDALDEDLNLYAVWAWAPVIKQSPQIRSFTYGERIPFEVPEIESVNDPEVTGYLEISETGEEGTWKVINHNTILPVSYNGWLCRLHASNSVGEAVSDPVKLSIKKASIDISGIRWVEDKNMVYDGTPKEVHIEGLPDTIEPRYEGNVATDAGTYTASYAFVFDRDNFNEPVTVREHEWTIRKAALDMSQVRWNYTGAFRYDGTARSVELTGLPEGVTAIYENNVATDTGVYTATAMLNYDFKNYEKPADIVPCVWEIRKVTIDASSIRWSDYDDFVYDGNPKGVYITNLPDDAEVVYDGAEETLAGKYLARAAFIGNYNTNAPAEYEWEIAKRHYDLSNVRWTEQRDFSYDGEPHGIVLTGVPEDLQVRYSGNVGVTAGSYTARAVFINPDTHNYITPADMTMEWQISKKFVDMSQVRWDYEGAFTYDGEAKAVSLVGLPEGIGVDYENFMAFDAGEYNARAILRYDEDNLDVEWPADCQWRINKKKIDVSGIYWDYSDAFTYTGREHAVYLAGVPEGLNVEYADNVKTETGTYVASATLTPVDEGNYEVPEVNGCTWTIRKAEYEFGAIEWTDYRGFVYDGKEKKVRIESGLDENIRVEYEDDTAVNAGRYFTKAVFSLTDDTNLNPPKPEGYSWSIAKARHDMSKVVWDYENAFTYDGSEKSVRLRGVPEGVIVNYRNASASDAGDYTAVARFEVQDANNYETSIPDMVLDWTIRKAVFDMSGAKWQGDREYAYDGELKGESLRLTGLPDGVVPVYVDSTAVDAGEYTAKAMLAYDEKNYEKPEVASCHWVIEKSPLDLSNISWDYDRAFVYDGSEKRVFVSDVPVGARVEYSNAWASQAGTYVAAAEIIPDDSDNLIKGRLENLTWRIERGDYDMSHAHWDYDKAFVYDGEEHKVVIKGLPEGVTAHYRGNTATNSGDYSASVTFTVADEHNYNIPEMADLSWSIAKADYDLSSAAWTYEGELTYTGSLQEVTLRGLPEGVRPVYSGNTAVNTGSYEATADLIPYDPENYNKPSVGGCSWRIVKADYEMSAVRWDYNTSKTFNGSVQNVVLEHLPIGVSAIYYGNEAKEVGTYTASAELTVADPVNYNIPSVSDCDWEIVRAEYDLSGAYWDYDEGMYTYDGNAKTVTMKNLPEGLGVSYKGNSGTSAGEYLATASFETYDKNYETPDSVSIPWKIEQLSYDMSGVEWDYRERFTYDGSAKRVELTGLPVGIKVEYEENTAIDAGTYTAVARFSSESDNYRTPEDMYCTWMIGKADIDIRRVSWNYSQSFVYDGTAKTIELMNLPEQLEASYSNNSATETGAYTAHAELMPLRPDNYNVPFIRDCVWTIEKADYDMSEARWEGEFEFVYDGTEKGVYVTGLPEGVVPVYEGNTAVDAGSYTASVGFRCDTDNYNVPVLGDCSWTIRKAVFDMSGAAWYAEDRIVYDGTSKSIKLRGLPEGLTPVYSGNTAVNAGDYEASVEFEFDENNYYRPEFGGCRWHIAPADIDVDVSEIRWNYDRPFVYDGETKSVAIAQTSTDVGFLDKLRGRKPELRLTGVPDGFYVVYDNNYADQVGVYYASAKLISIDDAENYNELVLPKFRWEIVKASVDMSGVRWNYEGPFTYDGEEKSVELIGLPDNVDVTYSDNTGTDAGDHEAMAMIEVRDTRNYETPKPVSGCWWQINKATYDMSQAHWTYEDDIEYDGKEKTVRVTGLPEGVKVESYRGNRGMEAGSYTAEVFLRYQNKENFEEPLMPALRWRIQKKRIDTSEVEWDYDEETGFVFDEKLKAVSLTGVPDDVEVVYTDNVKAGAGTYVARAKLIYDTRNCEADSIPDLRWRIRKASYDTSKTRWTYEKPFRYDGTEKSIALTGLPASIAVRYRDNKASAIGTYTAKAYLTYDSDNYEMPEVDTMIDWSIIGREVE